jgi:hypothetical protein
MEGELMLNYGYKRWLCLVIFASRKHICKESKIFTNYKFTIWEPSALLVADIGISQ